jgi:hypothetical protein
MPVPRASLRRPSTLLTAKNDPVSAAAVMAAATIWLPLCVLCMSAAHLGQNDPYQFNRLVVLQCTWALWRLCAIPMSPCHNHSMQPPVTGSGCVCGTTREAWVPQGHARFLSPQY